MSKKLGIIVPYRNRKNHLKEFTRRLIRYMERFDIPYELIVVEQDGAHLFNRGMILNIGFKHAEKLKCDYVVFHDVDMIPVHVDYSYSDIPLQMANNFVEGDEDYKNSELFDEYFGGVTMFNMETFRKIDGYSNKYWGWGFEDTDLLHRCRKHGIELKTLKIKNVGNKGKTLRFNGENSFVRAKNTLNINQDITIFVSFYPNAVLCNHMKTHDDYNVFTIPGYDTAIIYNSFLRYSFFTFDIDDRVLFVNSKIKTNYKTNICVTISNKEIKMYQDGKLIGSDEAFSKFRSYVKEKNFYLGVSNPEKKEDYVSDNGPKFFKGDIDSFIVYKDVLDDDTIMKISQSDSRGYGKIVDAGKYIDSLHVHYDANYLRNYKLVDLSGNDNDGEIFNCEIADMDNQEYKEILIPHRRDSTFALLDHKSDGFYKNKWKLKATRWNELRFWNEVYRNDELIYNDGLSTLEFAQHDEIKISDNITHLKVGI